MKPQAAIHLDLAFEACRRVTRARARNFYYGLRLAPKDKRNALYTLYAWMRAADDLVDEEEGVEAAEVKQRLWAFRQATDEALTGRCPQKDLPMWVAFTEVAVRHGFERSILHDALDGQLSDLTGASCDTFEDLRMYCYRVASTAGLLCIRIFGYEDERARELAIGRGIAFQLTNILRDLGEDLNRGRVYLPADELAAGGISARDLHTWTDPEKCTRFIEFQSKRAADFYESSRDLEQLIEPDCRPVLSAMTAIYRGLLDKIQVSPSQVVIGPRVRLSPFRKGVIAITARRTRRQRGPVAEGVGT